MSRVSGTPRAVRLRSDRWLCVAALSGLAFGCVEQADEKPTKEDEEFIKKNLLTSDPTPQFVAHADLDGKVEYIGIDVSPNPAEPGKDVHLTHYWKVKSAPSDGWRLFTHVSGPGGKGFINVDHGAISGKYPVSRWKAGDIIRDQHSFHLPPNWAFNSFSVFTGLWRGNERMTIKSGPHEEGRVAAATIPVVVKVPPVLKRYLVRKTPKPIKIDGKLDEPAWKTAPSTGLFVNTMNGEPAYLSYISPVQINLLTPADLPSAGKITVQVSNGTLTSAASFTVTPQAVAPSFFLWDAAGHLAATHADYSYVGTATSVPAGTPAQPGETIILWGNGFGATNPPAVNGQVQSGAAPLVQVPTIQFNGANGTVLFGGLTGTGLYQFNVTVPTGLPSGDAAVAATIGGVSTQTGVLLTVQQ